MSILRRHIKNTRRAVIKLGTMTLTSSGGRLDSPKLETLVSDICGLHKKGMEIVLVSSGAIGAGVGQMGLKERPKELPILQALAAIGQCGLIRAYHELFLKRGINIAQVLLSRDDIQNRSRFLNAKNTLNEVLAMGAIPVINENDPLCVEEIRFGDNDTLSAYAALMLEAQTLVILSTVDGLYAEPPSAGGCGPLIPVVEKIDERIEKIAGGSGSPFGTGGMRTKIEAAKMVTNSGECVVIANAQHPGVLQKIFDGQDIGTLFVPRAARLSSRKRWIAFYSRPKGSIVVDEGAQKAVAKSGRSLLPSGIKDITGSFEQGDAVNICDQSGEVFARGLSNYSSKDLSRIKGMASSKIEAALGYKYYDEAVHRNNLTLL